MSSARTSLRTKHIFAMVHARNMEFIRDRGTLIWNVLFPFFLVFGFAFAFSGNDNTVLNFGVVGTAADPVESEAADTDLAIERAVPYFELPGVGYTTYSDEAHAREQVSTHQIDILLDPGDGNYIVNPTSSRGELAERLLLTNGGNGLARQEVSGDPIRYIDWFVPGVIGLNMMFSSLFGVGFVIVRYRKNGVLKRLKATPLSSLEFITAQMLSRLLIVTITSIVVYAGADYFLNFMMLGSYGLLVLITVVSIVTLISFGLIFAARFRSEEVANGVINIALWPMLAFSGVFFSLEEVPGALRRLAQVFPLTHFLESTRAVMLEGAGLSVIAPHLAVLAGMTAVFLTIAAAIFRWE